MSILKANFLTIYMCIKIIFFNYLKIKYEVIFIGKSDKVRQYFLKNLLYFLYEIVMRVYANV